ncbi:hypothetical protein [Egibacter rhizosphaerae]|uniref:hypothetical protein n=1 Tax=Egibacter rhizosphaerae TaxID=1670831 RepID=UPI0013F17022|nr:hypothetical protein [Egibacter rhizosphaerae]
MAMSHDPGRGRRRGLALVMAGGLALLAAACEPVAQGYSPSDPPPDTIEIEAGTEEAAGTHPRAGVPPQYVSEPRSPADCRPLSAEQPITPC